MITADQIRRMAYLSTIDLERLLGEMLIRSRFLGITNGGEFCYTVTRNMDFRPETKAFVKEVNGQLTATFE